MNEQKPLGLADAGPDQVFVTDRWTRYQWSRFVDGDQDVDQLLAQSVKTHYAAPRFIREVFSRLFADDVEGVDPVRPEDRWAEIAHREIGELPEFDHLRALCRGDRLLSGAATTQLAQQVLASPTTSPSGAEDPQPLRESLRGLAAFAQACEAGSAGKTEVEEVIKEMQTRGRAHVKVATDHADNIDLSELRRVLRLACQAGQRVVDQLESRVTAFIGWGTSASANATSVSPELKAALADQLGRSDKLQRLAHQAGRLRRIAAAKQRSKADHAREEVLDIGLGDDLGKLLPSELVKLTDPVLRLEVGRRLIERSVLQYELGGKEPQGRGPIVVCVDQSSSMEGAKEIWSKAIAIALLHVATMQRRRCRVIQFNAGVLRIDDWAPGKVDPLELIRSMEPFYGGGTAFEPPLTKAREAISSDVKLKKADVVLITDGEAELSESFRAEWIAAKKKYEFTTYAVHVDSPANVAPPQLFDLADTVLGIADLANDQAATNTLLGI